MSMRIRFKHSRKGIGEILSRAETQEMLHAKGLAVADQIKSVGVRVDGEPGAIPLPVEVRTTGRGIRARTVVVLDHPSGLAVEAKHKLLATNIDAARNVP
jgi:hypothetical protein